MEMFNEAMAKEVISYFNAVTGQRCKYTEENVEAAENALSVYDMGELKDRMKGAYEANNEVTFKKCLNSLVLAKAQERNEEKVEAVKGLSLLEKAVVEMIAKSQTETLRAEMVKDLRHVCDSFLIENYGTIERKVRYTVNDKSVDFGGEVVHGKFDTVLKFVANDEPVFLTGAAGCGKNVLCKQVAKALEIPFYFSNAVTQEYKITGFTDANGIYHETQFYKAFKNGGLFMLDEMDASIPEVLVILNSAIANKYFDFPAPIGYVEAHPDFRVIAAGNTFGLGADIEYVGRNQLDMASLDRFAVVEMAYDKDIEMNVTNGDVELVEFAELFRTACEKAGVRTVLSYRGLGRIAKMQEGLGLHEAMKTCLIKSLQKDDIQMIIKEINVSTNKYVDELRTFTK